MDKQFAVIGLGRFGGSICREFAKMGYEVMAVDRDIERVNEYASIATQAVQANSTDEKALSALGIRNFNHVIVSIGEDIQSSILTTLLLKEAGVNKVWVKAQNDYHHKVLEKVGADRIIHPERDMALRVAQLITSEKIIDFIELSNEHSIIEVGVTDKLAGKTLTELDVRAKYGCNIVAIKKDNDILVSPIANVVLRPGDVLVVIGQNKDLNRFENEGV
ncbi:TrkA family potassium uptake protein [Fictibacillus sp. WQ 8-8]|uniref:TrkA family potassium uptake protein n=1 Tax=Fictibacillus marinisediminis TaxID=2878389 RepID=A0A9X2BCR9_9BACL|nr:MULTISPECIES: TrkA family potassium uptake protein [Fictibacillus]MCK6255955.1 TrkA family potassium uptake protein [Fictibacillus marinisediminis]MCQ6266955.1 TrkA family potassium uptake protein [Fictibacillus sp. WQ 8-8]